MKKVVILNDTSSRGHHGCSRVMRVIKGKLKSNGFLITATSFAHTDWQTNTEFLARAAEADLIIVNGEGTLHDGRDSASILLSITEHPLIKGKLALINALWENNPKEWNDRLSRFDLISCRDSRSASEIEKGIGRKVDWLPDLSLAENIGKTGHRCDLIVGDSVRWKARRALANFANANRTTARVVPTKTLPFKLLQLPFIGRVALQFLYRVYTGCTDIRVARFELAKDENQYLSYLSNAKLHVTGRFHGICLSVVTRTPFIAIAANGSKSQRLLHDIGLDPTRLVAPEQLLEIPLSKDFSPEELRRIEVFLGKAQSDSDALFASLRQLVEEG